MESKELKQKIEDLVSNNEFKAALTLIDEQISDTEVKRDVIVIGSRLNELNKGVGAGMLTREQQDVATNKIRYDILNIPYQLTGETKIYKNPATINLLNKFEIKKNNEKLQSLNYQFNSVEGLIKVGGEFLRVKEELSNLLRELFASNGQFFKTIDAPEGFIINFHDGAIKLVWKNNASNVTTEARLILQLFDNQVSDKYISYCPGEEPQIKERDGFSVSVDINNEIVWKSGSKEFNSQSLINYIVNLIANSISVK